MTHRGSGGARGRACLDLDQHWSDGTHDIIRRLQLGWISHHSPGPQAPRGFGSENEEQEATHAGLVTDGLRENTGGAEEAGRK